MRRCPEHREFTVPSEFGSCSRTCLGWQPLLAGMRTLSPKRGYFIVYQVCYGQGLILEDEGGGSCPGHLLPKRSSTVLCRFLILLSLEVHR